MRQSARVEFWETRGFLPSVITGMIALPTTLIGLAVAIEDWDLVPRLLPWAVIAGVLLLAWMILTLLMFDSPSDHLWSREHWTMLLGLVAGAVIGLILLIVLFALVDSRSRDERRRY